MIATNDLNDTCGKNLHSSGTHPLLGLIESDLFRSHYPLAQKSNAALNCQKLFTEHEITTIPVLKNTSLPRWKEKKAKDFISMNLASIQISQVAKQCALSRSHFSRAFKQATGFSPKEWIVNRRINRAQEMLIAGKLTLAQISQECGFSDQPHFSRVFRSSVGCTPSKWRQAKAADNHLSTSPPM